MIINYNQIDVEFKFAKPISHETYPLFLVRSILGKELRALCCVARQNQCDSCPFNQTCAYSWLFETILEKNNSFLPGRIRGGHPWSLKLIESNDTSLVFTIVLMGKALDFLPYIYAALKRNEPKGFGKERIPFEIISVKCDGSEILSDSGKRIELVDKKVFELNEDCDTTIDIDCTVQLLSPLRITKNGEICKTLDPESFFPSLNRRIRTAFLLYGENKNNEEKKYSFSKFDILNQDLKFVKMNRWSSRQGVVQNLGGIQGSFSLKGKITPFEYSLLKASEIFGGGKLTNFGLGQMIINEK